MPALPDNDSFPVMPAGWRPADDALRASHPSAPWAWLLETGSLTRRLQDACDGEFVLRVLGEHGVTLDARVATLLGVESGGHAHAREVHLTCAGVPCIYALSLLPRVTIEGGGRYLDGLGTRPLGDALFSDPGLERGAIEIMQLHPGDALYARTGAAGGAIWGRRSVFRTGGSPLLVSEFFLPGLSACAS